MNLDIIKEAAKKSFIAMKNPYGSVDTVFPEIIDNINLEEEFFYTGVKNVPQIPQQLLKHLKTEGNYLLHTLDGHAIGGRAIDMQRMNPISGRPMTGSSSGTAINVLLGINDLGIGTDGGGSVLAPAVSVNLYGFISKLICEEYLNQFSKKSTDNISFTPSIGYITRSYTDLKRAIDVTLDLPKSEKKMLDIGRVNKGSEDLADKLPALEMNEILFESPNALGPRKPLITFLNEILPKVDFILVEEGPIDFYGLGDSVLGHFDQQTKNEQEKGNKGLIRVANMVGATALTIPKTEFASAYVLISESIPNKISNMISFAEQLIVPEDELVDKYFRSFDNYFSDGYLH